MPVPSSIADLSTTPASNSPAGSETPSSVDDYLRTAFAFIRQSYNVAELSGFRNLIINGNFAINQRGYTSGTATTAALQYTLDRWRVYTSGQNITFAASGNGNQATAPDGGFEQVIEGKNIGGGTYTLSWSGTATALVNGAACANGGNVTLPANTNATVGFLGGTVSLVQLEPGTIATPFEQRFYGIELALCQRYYQIIFLRSVVAQDNYIGIKVARYVPMRATPTITFKDNAGKTSAISTSAGDGYTVGVGGVIRNSATVGVDIILSPTPPAGTTWWETTIYSDAEL